MLQLTKDQTFSILLRLTRRVFDLNGLTRIGRLSSYSVICLLAHFLTHKGVLSNLDDQVKNLPSLVMDKVCSMEWDYRLPERIIFNWPEAQNNTIQAVDYFTQFVTWLSSQDFAKVFNCRSGTLGKGYIVDGSFILL